MRVFVVNGEYDKAEICTQLLKQGEILIKECETIQEAMSECQTITEDKIALLILNTVREEEEKRIQPILKVQTFGNFEVFYEGKPVSFVRAKSKELLAYLIDRRGSAVTTAEASSVLWEDKEYNFSLQRQFQTVVSDLIKSLRRYKLDYLIRRRRNCLSVDVSGLECDLYELLEGDVSAANRYSGEYMSNYSWAEMTEGFLTQKYGNRAKNEKEGIKV